MADFNVDVGNAPTGSRPQQPVQDTSAAEGLNLLGNLFVNTASVAKSAIVSGQKEEAATKAAGILGGIRENLLVKADLVDQGWSSDRARRAARRQLASDLSNHPGLTKEITELYNNTLSKTGLAANIVEGTQAEKDKHDAKMKVFQDAQAAGLIPSDLDPDSDKADSLMDTYQQYRLHATQLEMTQKELTAKRAQIGLQTDVVQLASAKQSYVTGGLTQQTARLNLQEKQAEVQSRVSITGGAKAYNTLLSNKLSDTYDKFKKGQLTPQEASLQIDQDTAQVLAMANQMAPNAGGDYVRNTLAPITGLANSFKEAVTGKLDADGLQNQLNAATTRMTLMQIHDHPEVLPVIAMGKVLPNIPTPVLVKMTSDAFKMVGFNPDTGEYNGTSPTGALGSMGNDISRPANMPKPKLPDFTGQSGDVKAAIGYTKAGIESVLSGQANDEGSISEVNNTLKTAIRSAIKYGPSVDNATELNGLVDLFASSSFGKYIKSGKFTLTNDDASKTREMLRQHYENELVPLLRQEFVNSSVITGQTPNATGNVMVPTTDATVNRIQPSFDGNGIKFVATNPTGDVSRTVTNLNRNVAPVFNKTIKAYANLEGTDLRSQYELLMASIDPQASDRAGIPEVPTP